MTTLEIPFIETKTFSVDTDDLLPGPQGDPGQGVPVAGSTGQILSKASSSDYDTAWISLESGAAIWVDVRDYGAVCDAVVNSSTGAVTGTDDTTAIQAAVNAALSAGKGILIPALCKLTASINLNRTVDGLTPNMPIYGGGQGGFACSTAITMFTSSTAGTTDPVSEGFIFDSLKFVCGDASLSAYTISSKLFRCIWRNCEWRRMKFINSSIYTQSHYFSDCVALNWQGTFYTTVTCYDIRSFNFRAEHGAGGFFKDTGTYTQASFNGGNIEGCSSGIPFDVANSAALSIENMNFEINPTNDIKLGAGTASIKNCWFYPSGSNYSIDWGTASGVTGNNKCTGNLHDNDSAAIPLHQTGSDVASGTLYKTPINVSNADEWTSYTPTVTSGTGTLTSASATGSYKRLANNLMHATFTATITTNGTGATDIRVTLPNAAAANATLHGQEVSATGKMLTGTLSSGQSTCLIRFYDATYPGANGYVLRANIFYQC